MYQFLSILKKIRKNNKLSERQACSNASISRLSLRNIENKAPNLSLNTINDYAKSLSVGWGIYTYKNEGDSGYSVVATCLKTERDGFDSWKIHYMDLVDEFRSSLDMRLVLSSPPTKYNKKLKALIASIVLDLCAEVETDAPDWAYKNYYLSEPWFLSETESLKASALVESPAYYKKNNIFVLENFLKRA